MWVLGIRDKKDFKRWTFSQPEESIAVLTAKYGEWLTKNPGAVITFQTRQVWVSK